MYEGVDCCDVDHISWYSITMSWLSVILYCGEPMNSECINRGYLRDLLQCTVANLNFSRRLNTSLVIVLIT